MKTILIMVLTLVALPAMATDPLGCDSSLKGTQCTTQEDTSAFAGGITSCTSNIGCLACGRDVYTGKPTCVSLERTSKFCECSVSRRTQNGLIITECVAKGTCTYKA